jgi:hypothetical protein
MEVRQAVVAGDHRLAIDQERRGLDAAGGVNPRWTRAEL